jgi:hypothetical protein
MPVPLIDDRHSDGSPSAVWFTMCAWCARMKVGDRWIDVELALEMLSHADDLQLTHGICPSCFEEAATRVERERHARADRPEAGDRR